MKTTFPFDVGTYLFYSYQNKTGFIIIRTIAPHNKNTWDSEGLEIAKGNIFNSNQTKWDRLLQLQDLELCVKHMKKYNESAKQFLKGAVIWCLLNSCQANNITKKSAIPNT